MCKFVKQIYFSNLIFKDIGKRQSSQLKGSYLPDKNWCRSQIFDPVPEWTVGQREHVLKQLFPAVIWVFRSLSLSSNLILS